LFRYGLIFAACFGIILHRVSLVTIAFFIFFRADGVVIKHPSAQIADVVIKQTANRMMHSRADGVVVNCVV